jgi:hypothetical protein
VILLWSCKSAPREGPLSSDPRSFSNDYFGGNLDRLPADWLTLVSSFPGIAGEHALNDAPTPVCACLLAPCLPFAVPDAKCCTIFCCFPHMHFVGLMDSFVIG